MSMRSSSTQQGGPDLFDGMVAMKDEGLGRRCGCGRKAAKGSPTRSGQAKRTIGTASVVAKHSLAQMSVDSKAQGARRRRDEGVGRGHPPRENPPQEETRTVGKIEEGTCWREDGAKDTCDRNIAMGVLEP